MRTRAFHGALALEIVTTLAITAMLMVATAVATRSAFQTAATHEGQSTAGRATRQIGQRLSLVVRTASVCQVGTGAAAGASKTGTALYVLAKDGNLTAYVYDADNRRLLLDTRPATPTSDSPNMADIRGRMLGNTPSVQILGDRVTRLTFTGKYASRPDPGNPATNVPTLVNLQINVEITENEQTMHHCESVVPRRTQL